MLRILSAAVAIAMALFVAPGISSASVIDNTSLDLVPGVFYGTGNAGTNFAWTVDNEANGVQLGLQTIIRFAGGGPVTPTGDVYMVPTGATSTPGKTGSTWDFVFSVNSGSNPLAGETAIISMQDLGRGTSGGFNLNLIPDNAKNGNVEQNAETLSFASIAVGLNDPLFDLNANDTYDFELTLFGPGACALDCSLTKLGEVDMTVVAGSGATAVPEPSSLSLFIPGLLGLGFVGFVGNRRRDRGLLSAA
jgi:hypothetical protein